MRFKLNLAIFLLTVTLVTAANAETILPDACGKDDVKFDVKTLKNQPPPGPPAEGQAKVVILLNANGVIGVTMRFGVDGNWVGANKGTSYFAIDLAPGHHHFCAAADSHFKSLVKSLAGMTDFSLEAGKTYYLQYVLYATGGGGGGMVAAGPSAGAPVTGGGERFSRSETFVLISEDEGQYHAKSWPLSVSKAK